MSADDEFRVVSVTRTQRNFLASLKQTWPLIEPVVSAWDKTPARPAGSIPLTLRQLIERGLIRLDEGSPRSFVRLNLMNALKRLDEAEREFYDIHQDCDLTVAPYRLVLDPDEDSA